MKKKKWIWVGLAGLAGGGAILALLRFVSLAPVNVIALEYLAGALGIGVPLLAVFQITRPRSACGSWSPDKGE